MTRAASCTPVPHILATAVSWPRPCHPRPRQRRLPAVSGGCCLFERELVGPGFLMGWERRNRRTGFCTLFINTSVHWSDKTGDSDLKEHDALRKRRRRVFALFFSWGNGTGAGSHEINRCIVFSRCFVY